MTEPVPQLRMFERERDYPTMVEWCDAHGTQAAPAALLPPLGVVVERAGKDVAMLFLYFSLSCPVAFIDGAVTAPKTPVRQTVEALGTAYGYLKNEANVNGYSVMLAHVSPAFAKFMGRYGFNIQQEGMVRMFALTGEA